MSYCMAMDAWGKLAGHRAEVLRKRMGGGGGKNGKRGPRRDYRPETEKDASIAMMEPVYDDIERVKEILQYMHDLHDSGSICVVPNTVAYNPLIGAYARISNP